MNKRLATILAAGIVVTASAAFGAVKAEQLSVSPVVGGYSFDSGQHLKTSPLFGARAGYNFTGNVGIEALFDFVSTEKTNVDGSVSMFRYGAEMLYHFMPETTVVPYLAAGFSGINIDANDTSKRARGAFSYGIGAKFFLNDDFALRGDVRHIITKHDSATYNNVEYTLGAYIPFGGAAPAVKTVVHPVVAAPLDSDGDGVPDSLDKCPNTPPGVAVDANGCPIDSDKDGVPDYLDKCPNTPPGVAVDANGCPVDSDKDGVPDYLDKCPNTPPGVAVDADGCPLDSDKDGVPDYLDKCPNTPLGTKVDSNGCPEVVKITEAAKRFCDKPAVINITFDTDKADIKPEFKKDLDKLGEFLKEFPTSKGVITGHTDNDGSREYNDKLSLRRANSAKKYLEDAFGVAPARISAKGFGFSKPLASNDTEAGKAQNRRIETNFICE